MSGTAFWHQRFIRETGPASAVAELVEPILEGMEFRLVRVQIMGNECAPIVQIMFDHQDKKISIEDCEYISTQISPVLDACDPISTTYRLEISSPGIDRPLVRPSDFEDWKGYEAKIELYKLYDGRRRFSGVIEGFHENEVRVEVNLEQVGRQILGFPIESIESARLVLTDELIQESLRRSKNLVGKLSAEIASETALAFAGEERSSEVKGK